MLCVIDIFTKCSWIIPLKDERGITINNDFQKILDESNRKPNIIWIDKGSKFYNRTMKSEIEESEIEMYSTHDEGKSVVAERFIKISKNEIHKYITSISKNMYIDKLNDIVNKYNNIYHTTIKKNPSVLNQAYILTLNKENNKEGSKLKIGVSLEYQNIETSLQKTLFQIGLKKFLWLKKSMLFVMLKVKKTLLHFTNNNCKKQIKNSL